MVKNLNKLQLYNEQRQTSVTRVISLQTMITDHFWPVYCNKNKAEYLKF